MTVPKGMAVPNIIEFVTDPQLLGLSVSPAQETLLRAIYALPMTSAQRDIYRLCTGRDEPPTKESGEVTVISGVRSGKDSRIATPIAAYEAAFGEHDLALSTGETGVIAIVCQDMRATSVTYSYLRAYFEKSPILRTLLADEPRAQSLDLVNRLQVRCFPTVAGSMRSWSIPVGIMNEPQLYQLEGSANSDVEIQVAMRRGMVGFARTKLVKIATPYMKSGVVYDDFTQAFGRPDPDRLVWRSTTALMNPSITEARLAQQRRLDPVRFEREFEAVFADDVAAFVPRAWIEAAVQVGRFELPPNRSVRTVAVIDPSGGGLDAFTFSIVFLMPGGRVVQAVMKGQARHGAIAPDLEGLVREYMTLAKQYGCKEIISDRYAAGWVRQAVERHSLRFIASEYDRSQAYLNLEPLLAQGRIELLDHPQMIRELALLERRPSPGGKDVVNHPRGGHDDYANALALAATYATLQKPEKSADYIMPNEAAGRPAGDSSWRDKYFGIRSPRSHLDRCLDQYGLLPAPQPGAPSHALQDMREARSRREAHEQAEARLTVARQRELDVLADTAQTERDRRGRWRSLTPAARAELRAAIQQYGRDTTEGVLHWELPADLSD